jgi:phage terminase large subunit-like protein
VGARRVLGQRWVRGRVESGHAKHIALVNDTSRDTRAIIVERPDGIVTLLPDWCKPYSPKVYGVSRPRELNWSTREMAISHSP